VRDSIDWMHVMACVSCYVVYSCRLQLCVVLAPTLSELSSLGRGEML
jgi:hypothetical protein